MAKIPAIESELLNIIALKQLAQMMRHKFVGHSLARRCLQMPLRMPQIVRHAIRRRPCAQSFDRQPESWVNLPFPTTPADEDERRQIIHRGKVEPTINRNTLKRRNRTTACLPHHRRDEKIRRL